MIPYTRHHITTHDVDTVAATMCDGDLATGRITEEFEHRFAEFHGYAHGVAVNSGTSALYVALCALGLPHDTEIVTSPLTFVATASMIALTGHVPVFADVDAQSLNITNHTVKRAWSRRTVAALGVDYGGMLCRLDEKYSAVVDAAHSVGCERGQGRIRCYSTHAAKNLTTCEGGVALTDDADLARTMRLYRSHGIDGSYRDRTSHSYEVELPGFNMRMPDPLAALGLSQLSRLRDDVDRRAEIVHQYQVAFKGVPGILLRNYNAPSAHHLYVVMLDTDKLQHDRDWHWERLRKHGIGVNVHYRPVYLFRAFQARYGYEPGLCPNAEWAYERLLTLPLYPSMCDTNQEFVIDTVIRQLKEDLA